MKKTTKTVLVILVGVVLCVTITVVGLGVWFFASAIQTVAADPPAAAQSFADVRARFNGVDPILVMRDTGPEFVRQPPETPPGRKLERVRLIAWDPDENQLASVTIPFWLVKMRDGPFSISASTFVPHVRVSVRGSQLERYGPALLFDQQVEDGSRVIIWTE
jgi:hypothetical protein